MKKFIFFLIITFTFNLNAQIGTSRIVQTPESKWTFGGYAGLGGVFGNGGGVSIYLSPRVGYKLSENLETGLATNVTWSNSKYYSATTVGVGPFMNFYIARNFYLSGMFQEYFYSQKDKLNNLKYSGDEAALYFGGGYMQKIGEHSYMQIGGMYNVLYKENESIFGSGFIPSIGVVFGV